MTQNDARAEVQLLTAIALQHCTASSTNRTYSSAWNSWVRVSEVYKYPVYCMDIVTRYPLPLESVQEALIQYISWQCGVCMLSPRSIRKTYLPGIAKTMDKSMVNNLFRTASKSPMVRCVLDGYRNMWARQHPASDSIKVPFTAVLAKEAIRLICSGQIKPTGLDYSGTSFLAKLMQAQLYAALIFGIFFLLRKSEYLTTKDPPPTHSGARILRRRSVAFFDTLNARILYRRIGHIPARSIRLIVDFSKTDQLGLGRLLIHCRQDEPNVICIVSILENWIAMTRDTFNLSEEDSVWQIPRRPLLTCDTIAEVMKATCDVVGLPRSHVSSHSLRYGGATELAAAGFPQYVISTYGGWTENSRALHIYTRLSQCTNELVSKHMSRAGLHRTVQTVVNDLLMHRQERSKHAQVSFESDSSTDRPTKSRKGGKPRENGGK